MQAAKILIVLIVGYVARLQAVSLPERSSNLQTRWNWKYNRCKNGGTRITTFKGWRLKSNTQRGPQFTCSCPERFYGNVCQFHVCDHHDCQKGACEADKTNARGYKCNCMEGYKGKNCEVHVCDQHVCQNGTCEPVTCKTSTRGYKCNCMEGYKGENCNVPVCDQHDCKNGTCDADKTRTRGYKCNCIEGYEGENCEVHVCDRHDCKNGTCESDTTRTRGYKCNCLEGYGGENCEATAREITAHAQSSDSGDRHTRNFPNYLFKNLWSSKDETLVESSSGRVD
ncbi:delta-like protein A [Saccostrea cucullata]|uniref:delta-like protein A n=1 Tax=Saccostrea cuccullata TaxID=36930 RepID=UPI002ED168F1